MIPEGKYLDVQVNFRFHFYDEGEGDVVVLFMAVEPVHLDIRILKITLAH